MTDATDKFFTTIRDEFSHEIISRVDTLLPQIHRAEMCTDLVEFMAKIQIAHDEIIGLLETNLGLKVRAMEEISRRKFEARQKARTDLG